MTGFVPYGAPHSASHDVSYIGCHIFGANGQGDLAGRGRVGSLLSGLPRIYLYQVVLGNGLIPVGLPNGSRPF